MGNTPRIVILSRHREKIGTTWNLFPGATLCVHESEEQAYRDAGLGKHEYWVHTCDRSATVRNFILNRVQELAGPGGEVILMDDDIRKVGRFEMRKGKAHAVRMDGALFLADLDRGFEHARLAGYHLFGVAPTTNPLNYDPGRSVKTNLFINGPLMCVRVTDARFDPGLPVKCDYDFTAQHIHRGLGVMRLDYLWQDNDFDSLPGGRACYKKDEDAAISFHILMSRWPQYMRANPRRPHEVILRAPKRRG